MNIQLTNLLALGHKWRWDQPAGVTFGTYKTGTYTGIGLRLRNAVSVLISVLRALSGHRAQSARRETTAWFERAATYLCCASRCSRPWLACPRVGQNKVPLLLAGVMNAGCSGRCPAPPVGARSLTTEARVTSNFLKDARGEEWLLMQAAIIVAKASSFISSSLAYMRLQVDKHLRIIDQMRQDSLNELLHSVR